ncbi:MAG: hypothetical protein KDD69_01890 [Bdellovibrionales bacterium]|nr:hypothetical protein [Bdellovibrionales bacterium]
MHTTAEHRRLEQYRERRSNWKHWGPYLSDRSWGTVREDYSADGNAWSFFPHEHARSRVFRWGEDGIGGICDRNQYLCFAPVFWNGNDPILKERLFGLTPLEGNHGEDVKELYFYLDSTPTHSFMRMLYKYPIAAFPYTELVERNRSRPNTEPEFELHDTGIFNQGEYFDCFVEYAKADTDDILIQLRIRNCSSRPAPLHVLPTVWFRNTWSWGYPHGPMKDVAEHPQLSLARSGHADAVAIRHSALGPYSFHALDQAPLLFTNNETNAERLYGLPNKNPYVKDAFERYLIGKELGAINPAKNGTKACFHFHLNLQAGEEKLLRFRLQKGEAPKPFETFDQVFSDRLREADEFYQAVQADSLSEDEKRIQRQAFAGMMWSKQLYYYDMEQWLEGDPALPPPPEQRKTRRNSDWIHLTNFDVISMPDKWEFPWYAAWDLAFHCIPISMIDPDFAKRQLELMTREWYMHPNGQMPAYEWAFDDVNPPVHAMAAWRVYKIEAKSSGSGDMAFLESLFHKMLLNFTWWVNRKDAEGHNIFQGGFLGLDNIGIFDRSAPLPTGGHIDQADGTSWMAAYCLTMMKIALELAEKNPVYQDSASKFLEHFLRVANAMTSHSTRGTSLWDEEDGFFYDMLHLPNGTRVPLKVRSLVGLIPLFAVDTIEPDLLEKMPDFHRRLMWFVTNRPHLSGNMARLDLPGLGRRRLTALLTRERLVRVLRYMFDENEFLSEYGIRSLSKVHEHRPFELKLDGTTYSIGYQPAESTVSLFGGNSNWRGPVWFPINFILIEALQKFHHYYGDSLKVEYPTHSGNMVTLDVAAHDIAIRLCRIFTENAAGVRPFSGSNQLFERDSNFKNLLLFNEYFHGDSGAGLGASHQTGWTGLVAKLLQQCGTGHEIL